MKFKLLFLFLVLSQSSLCQAQLASKIPPTKLQQDYDLFKTVLFRAHPNPYRLLDSSSWASELKTYESLLKDSLSELQFFQIVSATMSNIGEAHSGLALSERIKRQIKTSEKLLPLNIHFSDKRAYVQDDLTDNANLLGSEIVSINGRKIDQIIQKIDSISCIGSGYNQSRIYRKLSYQRNFALCYYLYVDQSKSFLIEYLEHDGSKATVVEGITPTFELSTLLNAQEKIPPFSLQIDRQKDLAIIKITTFAHFAIDYEIKDYLKFYKDAFKEIAKANISNLVIDVRDNRGGQEKLGAHLLAYFLEKSFSVHDYVYAKEINYDFLDSISAFHNTFNTKKFQAVDSGYVLADPNHITMSVTKPVKKNHFNGDVYFIVNGSCFSACNIFMALADYHNVGTIIGEESGGNYQDTDGYHGVIFNLPNTGIGIDFRLWNLKTSVQSPRMGRGILPNVPIQPSIKDVLNGKDAEMDKVYELIKNQENNNQ